MRLGKVLWSSLQFSIHSILLYTGGKITLRAESPCSSCFFKEDQRRLLAGYGKISADEDEKLVLCSSANKWSCNMKKIWQFLRKGLLK